MKTLKYTCRICGKPGEMPEPVGYSERWEFMLTSICHERCYDYREQRLSCETAIGKVCSIMVSTKDVEEAQPELRKRLNNIVKRWCENERNYHRTESLVFRDLAEEIASNPKEWPKIVQEARRMVKEASEPVLA